MDNKTINIYGNDKEVKFVVINKKSKSVSICFTDKTAVFLSDIKIVFD